MVQQSTIAHNGSFPASSVLVFEEPDGELVNSVNRRHNYWMAEQGKRTGQDFTVRVDDCARMIVGVDMKNTRNAHEFATDEFNVFASLNEEGPWEKVVDSFLPDTINEAAELHSFTFEQPMMLKYLKFELISYHGKGGGLQYFAAIPASSETLMLV